MSTSSIYPTSDRLLDLEAAIVACRNAAADHGYGLRLSTRKINTFTGIGGGLLE